VPSSAFQEKLIATIGGLPGVRDRQLLESAVMGCYQTFDGNKRAAVTATLVMLRINTIEGSVQ